MLENILVNLIGWKAMVLHGDPSVFDRWIWLKKYLISGNVRTLDLGCGSGAFTMYAAKIGNEAIGISFDKRNNEIASRRSEKLGIKNVRFIEADLRGLGDIADSLGKFDQIICLEIIEHIFNDQKLISDIVHLLKPEGRVLLTTPYKNYKPLFGEDPTRLSKVEDGGHVRVGYVHEEVEEIFEKSGMRVAAKEYVSGFVSQQVTSLYRILIKLFPYQLAWLLILPLRMLYIFDRLLTKLFNYPYLSIAVVGTKRI